MSCKKRTSNKTSNYLISFKRDELSKKSSGYIGKVRSNFLGTEFIVFDNGVNPKEAKSSSDAIRRQLATVVYESNLLGARGPRKMKVLIPDTKEDGTP